MSDHAHRYIRYEQLFCDSKGRMAEIRVRPRCSCGGALPEESYGPGGKRNY